jgi:hypothetical protein
MSATDILRSVPEDAACALLGAALSAAGVPAPIAGPVACAAPKVLAALAELLEGHAAGEPLPPIERAPLTDDAATLAALREQLLDEGDRPTDPGPEPRS